ncbi:uncharacterized protein K460DRAFT_366552 [Cucurbitaria berberidis CBS 394.84]|uniref:Uncharacterized protein n=1 Tax=Cucurbitaria berberidis CBS 394.84 TaxID=1168544 RepID=A0A9P4GIC3_9PLEO|nr:uncharacterized protein K460DRAFT_366552 [Cucurbitaria berberidis CBS 394.84]KAF1845711.1 hypothetical protein K460DRAFT_366552 [Cucurbitaria berberidis CBS 394.84]
MADVSDSLTVDLSKMPGQTFHRKALNGFKIQLKAMLIDTSVNSVATVLANLYQSFYESAVRCLEYARVLSKVRTTCSSLLISMSNPWPNGGQTSGCSPHCAVHGRSQLRQLALAIKFADDVFNN